MAVGIKDFSCALDHNLLNMFKRNNAKQSIFTQFNRAFLLVLYDHFSLTADLLYTTKMPQPTFGLDTAKRSMQIAVVFSSHPCHAVQYVIIYYHAINV